MSPIDTGGQCEPIVTKYMEIHSRLIDPLVFPVCSTIRSCKLRAQLIRDKRVTNRDSLLERISPFTLLSWVPIVPYSETTRTGALGRRLSRAPYI